MSIIKKTALAVLVGAFVISAQAGHVKHHSGYKCANHKLCVKHKCHHKGKKTCVKHKCHHAKTCSKLGVGHEGKPVLLQKSKQHTVVKKVVK